MRAVCGCQILDDVRKDPGEPGEAEVRADLAATQQRRWGCPRAGHSPPAALPPDLADYAQEHARVTGVACGRTCPFATQLSPWNREVLSVFRLASKLKGAVTASERLGRTPHVWDLWALDALIVTQAEVEESDALLAERERKERNPRR